jgi:hypothetical protein
MFVTLTSFNYLEGAGMDSVAAFDLNLNGANSVFSKVIAEYAN